MLVLNAEGHQFGFDSPHFLRYRDPKGIEETFPYQKGLHLSFSPITGEIRLKCPNKSISLAPLSQIQLREFLLELFRQWNREEPKSAKIAAMDYVNTKRGFAALAICASLLVSLPLAVVLLSSSQNQLSCTKELRQHSAPGTMQRTQALKKDAHSYRVHLEFRSPSGELIQSEEELVAQDDSELPLQFPIVYSPLRPECWSLSAPGLIQEVSWWHHRYFSLLGFLFGLVFLGTAVLGLGLAMAMLLRQKPCANEVKDFFHITW